MIPKIIHHIAPKRRKDWHPVWEKCLPSWYRHYPEPEYKHILWNDGDMIDRLVQQDLPHFYKRYQKMEHIMRIDFAKIVMIHRYGGMYVDMDFFCRENFHDDLVKPVVLSGSYHQTEDVQNGLIACVEGHPWMRTHIEEVIGHVQNKTKQDFDSFMNYVKYTTGPNSLGLTYFRNMHMSEEVQILPAQFYNPLLNTFYHDGIREGVKCVHYLSGWWGKENITQKKTAREAYQSWRGVNIEDIK